MNPHRITQKDIAAKAGISQVAVSAALRNRPEVSEGTRERVLRIAEELGYRPDPHLAGLIHHRQGRRPVRFRGVLGYLTKKPHQPHRQPDHSDQVAFAGFCQTAEALGYGVAVFDLWKSPLPPQRLTRILVSRGIRGFVIPKIDDPGQIPELDWERFGVVEIGHGMERGRFHRVTSDGLFSTRETLRNIARLGYEKPGLIMTRSNIRSLENWPEGIWPIACRDWKIDPSVPVFAPDDYESDALPAALGWIRTHRPDCLVSNLPLAMLILGAKGSPLSELPFACTNRKADQTAFAGIDKRLSLVGAKAAEVLAAQVQQNRIGPPDFPVLAIVQGQWMDGPSLPPREMRAGKR